jgi:hypothetical protein
MLCIRPKRLVDIVYRRIVMSFNHSMGQHDDVWEWGQQHWNVDNPAPYFRALSRDAMILDKAGKPVVTSTVTVANEPVPVVDPLAARWTALNCSYPDKKDFEFNDAYKWWVNDIHSGNELEAVEELEADIAKGWLRSARKYLCGRYLKSKMY